MFDLVYARSLDLLQLVDIRQSVVLLDTDVTTAMERVRVRGRSEEASLTEEYHRSLRQQYHIMIDSRPMGVPRCTRLINACRPLANVTDDVLQFALRPVLDVSRREVGSTDVSCWTQVSQLLYYVFMSVDAPRRRH